MKKGEFYILIFLFILILIMFFEGNFASAGFTDWFGKITGKATSQDTNVTITVSGTNAITIEVFNSTLTGATVTPSENSIKAISFTTRITDADGAADINTSSVSANFTRTGEGVRANSSCNDLAQDTATTKNFSCTINMYYFDDNNPWTVSVIANDLGNKTYIQNTTTTFTYGSLQAMVIHPNQVTWASAAAGATNQTSNNDPTVINNTGNYNFTGINVTAKNLYGETNITAFINVGNITIGNNTGSSAECDTSPAVNNATAMVNGTGIQIKHSILTRGNHSVNNGQTGQEQIYYCFTTVPTGIPSQTYSTTTGGAWTVRVIT